MTPTGAPCRATVSLAMIVKDEEANLAACLDSARGLFDETVVVDTGSADRTVKVARSFGARVFRFAWCDDFSAARNFSLGQVRTDYVFRLDADDRIPAGQHKRLRALLASLRRDHPEAITFRVEAEGSPGIPSIVSDEIRVWPNTPALRFVGRVHEQIGSSLQQAGISSRPGGVRLVHLGYTDATIYRRKLERNRAPDPARPDRAPRRRDLSVRARPLQVHAGRPARRSGCPGTKPGAHARRVGPLRAGGVPAGGAAPPRTWRLLRGTRGLPRRPHALPWRRVPGRAGSRPALHRRPSRPGGRGLSQDPGARCAGRIEAGMDPQFRERVAAALAEVEAKRAMG